MKNPLKFLRHGHLWSVFLKIRPHEKKSLGFTLIEVMIAMAILAILTTAGLMAYSGYLKKGRDSSRATVARQVNTEVMSYAASNGGRPPASEAQFSQFLQSASEAFGSSAGELANDTIIKDPLEGKDVCLDADKNATQPCAFHYTAYEDGTYAISYGIEDPSNMKTNFYKTTASVESPTAAGTPTTKYGVYIGTAPYIGYPVTTPSNPNAVDVPSLVTPAFIGKRIDTVTVSGGGGGDAGMEPTTMGDICNGSPAVGTECADGTIYITASLRATPSDNTSDRTWNSYMMACNGGCTPQSYVALGATSMTDGATNTAVLVAANKNFLAAEACSELSFGGHDDWYLPAKDQLNVLFSNKDAIGNFETAFYECYWSSSEVSPPENQALWAQYFNTREPGFIYYYAGYVFEGAFGMQMCRVRCVRTPD